ncbi:heavy metal-associated domain-containing protein [uncultured Lacinutrix sp.]|uniref:cation transporter n=1 Tax=uncultured Lacinutrix sp. TaxID=574032 RepID=UPI0026077DB6|nr:heavy metal-associated domain-containing protein [uncultured Lacinutrix sp.]
MNTIKNILAIAIIAVTAFSCKNEVQPEVKTVETAVEAAKTTLDPNATYAKAEFKIEGMTCAMGCAKTIEKKMAKMEGVKSATVDFDRQLAMVEYDEAKVTPANLEGTVTSVADIYKVKDMKTVEAFSKKECKADCKKDCCKNKTEAEKKACAKDCKKACCTKEAKA